MTTPRLTRALLSTAGALAASAAFASSADAALVATTTDCGTPEITQPFTAFGDANSYKLVGAFEDGAAGWKLTGGARVVAGNEPARVHDASDANSLSLPAGSTATSPLVCVGHDEPTIRFFGRGAGLLPALTVSIQVQLFLGTWLTLPIGVDSGSSWAPSAALHSIANYLPGPGEYTAVRFVFSPLLSNWQIDDVYVDPRMRI